MNLHLPFRRLIPLAAAAVLVAAAFGLAACSIGGGSGDAQKVVDQTFGAGSDLKSGKMSFEGKFSGKMSMKAGGEMFEGANLSMDEIPISADVKATGAFSNLGKNRVPKFDVDMTVAFKTEASGPIPAVNQSMPMGFVFTGDRAVVKIQGANYEMPETELKQALASAKEEGKSQSSLGGLGVDPRDWLTNMSEEGTENVNGVETTHVSGDLDLEKFVDDVDELSSQSGQAGAEELTSEQQEQLKDAVKKAKVDIFTGKDDKILRKMTMSFEFDGETEQSQAGASIEMKFEGEASFDLELSAVNEPQKISAPKGTTRPFSRLQGDLGSSLLPGGGFGAPSLGTGTGGGGGGTPGGGTGGGSGGGSSKDAKGYLDCVEKAKDAGAVAQCESLLK